MILNKWLNPNRMKSYLVTYSCADSKISDQFRKVRTNMKFLPIESTNRIYLFTSPGKSEGKSTIIANLAVSLAQQKEKILLIDANLRNPSIHEIFRLPNHTGLTDLILQKQVAEKVIYKTEIGKLDVLTSGSTNDNPAELIGHHRVATILQAAKKLYDMILIDAPNILETTETRILANQSDGVILVLNRGKTDLEKTVEAKRTLELAHAKLVGTIINERK
ncbi:CpsD/CapB family tyrosine-protein kinase [Ornithinibacillus gellani]|uniref:CpsD/CapB family tyrosine-protein kinase n=1 Tax=Ornithinibacillus gellani TaxID=2293253 RepID=UPI001CC1EC36|nr:CpsD/CapB family tyrosine-protein kinase [Ornithinibacillus gellani]